MSSFLTEKDPSQPPTNNTPAVIKLKEEPKAATVEYLFKASFMITYILLLTTATITFIEALRTDDPTIRHIFNLETCISLVAGYFYSVFVAELDTSEKNKHTIDWPTITKTRYIDWSITTPFMLLVLCLFLANESKRVVRVTTVVCVVILNYIMLYFGYLGETGVLDRMTACIGGFVPFIALFYLIYSSYVVTGEGFGKYFLFVFYIFFWTGYGLVYLLEEAYKNIAMNILDCISKCFVGIGIWMYYTNIMPEF